MGKSKRRPSGVTWVHKRAVDFSELIDDYGFRIVKHEAAETNSVYVTIADKNGQLLKVRISDHPPQHNQFDFYIGSPTLRCMAETVARILEHTKMITKESAP